MNNLPEFLCEVEVPAKNSPLRRVNMNGWLTLNEYLRYNKERLNEKQYAQLMLLELERQRPRLAVLSRLKSKFDKERRRREMVELAKLT